MIVACTLLDVGVDGTKTESEITRKQNTYKFEVVIITSHSRVKPASHAASFFFTTIRHDAISIKVFSLRTSVSRRKTVCPHVLRSREYFIR